ncbi:MotA/TolQ/ExbB proton channel family protein [Pampinifervens florentissimum]|uniref:MotA/TolQ/ExbB proton channel family protein n=1 Tax=Pampinifervens florentissimum TaxID=1632019 RepID=UPI0013B481F9|nr:MotA/TolQ/ExbB proton channel family protein [Hydrogenobacter sp. T-8]QID32993.1 MotA/TolQ/ExbB proton channel family protein [Hydrogenobacter sp. T-8]
MEGLFELFQKGGLAMYPLIFLSVVSWAVIVERVFHLRSSFYIGKSVRDLKPLIASGDIEGAIKLLSTESSFIANLLKDMLQGYRDGKVSKEDMIKVLDLELSLLAPRIEKNLPLLSTTASVAPLIGLFGTITGLIKVFSAFATANPEQAMVLLSKGISEALVAAATGLAVAIPALIAYWLFRIWGNSILDRIEFEIFEVLRMLR